MTHDNSTPLVETVPAVAGLVFSLAAAVQFLNADFSVGALDYQFAPAHAFVVSLAALIVVFASSKENNVNALESWEQVLVGVTLLIMTAHQYVPTVETAVSNNNPHAGGVVFLMGIFAWVVLSR
jgi:hypothetical protein